MKHLLCILCFFLLVSCEANITPATEQSPGLSSAMNRESSGVNIPSPEVLSGSQLPPEGETTLQKIGSFFKGQKQERRVPSMRETAGNDSNMPNLFQAERVREESSVPRKITEFPLATTTWGKALSKGEVPAGKFRATYVNTQEQTEMSSFLRDDISITNYMQGDMDHFGAYFEGNIEVKEAGVYEFIVSQSWATTRLILDGHVLTAEGSEESIAVDLPVGSYKLEVEFANTWHIVDFSVNVMKQQKTYSQEEILTLLGDIRTQKDLDIWAVGIYQSDMDGHKVPLVLKKSTRPVVLFLSSYGTAHWEIQNPEKVQVAAVVFSGFDLGSTARFTGEEKTPIYKLKERDYLGFQIVPTCIDAGGMYHCEGEQDFQNMRNMTTKLFGNIPAGFTGIYGAQDTLSVPETVLDKAAYDSIQKQMQDIQEERKKIESKPQFEKLFQ